MQIPCVYLPGPAPAVSVANIYNWKILNKKLSKLHFQTKHFSLQDIQQLLGPILEKGREKKLTEMKEREKWRQVPYSVANFNILTFSVMYIHGGIFQI